MKSRGHHFQQKHNVGFDDHVVLFDVAPASDGMLIYIFVDTYTIHGYHSYPTKSPIPISTLVKSAYYINQLLHFQVLQHILYAMTQTLMMMMKTNVLKLVHNL